MGIGYAHICNRVIKSDPGTFLPIHNILQLSVACTLPLVSAPVTPVTPVTPTTPATGLLPQTSFIKALAQYTNRHIVNIPLNKIKTNQELMNIMFDQKIMLSGSEDNASAPLPHSRVIFVMEDVDAASSVVHRRETAPAAGEATAAAAAAAEAMMFAAAIAASTSSPPSGSSSSGGGSGGAIRDGGTSSTASTPEGGAAHASSSSSSGGGGGDFGIEVSSGGSGGSALGPLCLKDFLKDSASDSDKLNLASLLNVLDGEGRYSVPTLMLSHTSILYLLQL